MPQKVANGLDLQNRPIENLGTPSAPLQAATKAYVDAFSRSVDWKDSVRAAASGNVNLASPGAAIDGVTLAVNDRVLLFGQTNAVQNGIYVFNGASSALTRATDADESAEVTAGLTVTVTEGTALQNTSYRLITPDPITLGTTALNFTNAGGAAAPYSAGNGLNLTGQQFSVKPKPSGGILVDGDGLSVDRSVVPRKFSAAIGDGSATSITVTHNLGTVDFTVTLVEVATGAQWIPDVSARTTTTATLLFGSAPAAGAFRVVIIG